MSFTLSLRLGLVTVLSSTSLVSAGVATAAASAACQVHLLSLPGDEVSSAVQSGDPTGRWLAGWVETASDRTVVRWRDGVRSTVDLGELRDVEITGINRHGDLTGTGWDSADLVHTFAVVDGSYGELTSGEWNSVPSGISQSGQVSGTVWGPEFSAVVWDVADPDNPTELEIPSGFYGSTSGITPKGVVALQANESFGSDERSYVVGANGPKRLRPTENGRTTFVAAIATGWAVGYQSSGAEAKQVRWDLANGRTPSLLRSDLTAIRSVNANEVVAGDTGSGDAGLVIGRRTRPLPDLETGGFSSVRVVADNRQAAGSSTAGGEGHAVRWTC